MFYLVLDALGFVLVSAIAVHSVVLHVRLVRLRRALADAGRVLPSLDASVCRMIEIASGFSQKLQADLATVDGRLTASRRLSVELAAARPFGGSHHTGGVVGESPGEGGPTGPASPGPPCGPATGSPGRPPGGSVSGGEVLGTKSRWRTRANAATAPIRDTTDAMPIRWSKVAVNPTR